MFVTVIEDNGGIHMFDIVVGSKVSLTRKEVMVDPDRNEQYGVVR